MSLGSIARGILGTVAPILGAAVGGPLGGLAIRAISEELLGVESADGKVVERALEQATPEQLAQLKRLDQDFERQMKELDLDIERMHSDDRKSARDKQAKTGDWVPSVLGLLTVGGFFAALVAFMLGFIPDGAQSEFAIMLGILGGVTTQVYNFYFGSSKGSQDKNNFINK